MGEHSTLQGDEFQDSFLSHHVPATMWGEGDRERHQIATRLAALQGLPTSLAVEVDSLLTTAIFSRKSRKNSRKRGRNMQKETFQTLKTLDKIDVPAETMIINAFEEAKTDFLISSPDHLFDAAKRLAVKLYEPQASPFKSIPGVDTNQMMETLSWYGTLSASQIANLTTFVLTRFITAYSLVISKEATVRLSTVRFPGTRRQFGIKATVPLVAEEIIYDLVGCFCSDVSAEHSGLSVVKSEDGSSRVLYGPIRYVNHGCHPSNNAEVFL